MSAERDAANAVAHAAYADEIQAIYGRFNEERATATARLRDRLTGRAQDAYFESYADNVKAAS